MLYKGTLLRDTMSTYLWLLSLVDHRHRKVYVSLSKTCQKTRSRCNGLAQKPLSAMEIGSSTALMSLVSIRLLLGIALCRKNKDDVTGLAL